jgi:hypothetical protein
VIQHLETTVNIIYPLLCILNEKIQVKLMKLAKDLSISEWEMIFNLEHLPDVRKQKNTN